MRLRTNLWFSAMTCGWWNAPKYVIAHLLRDLWIASSQAPRNDVKCAALSLAALNDFVCEANGTYVHSVKAMPQAAQKSFACFSLLVHFLFLLRNQKEKMNNNLHNLCMWSIDAHNMCYVTNYLRYTAMTIYCVPSPARGGPGWGTI